MQWAERPFQAIAAIIVLILFGLWWGVSYFQSPSREEYVPSRAESETGSAEFIVDGRNVTGLYGNLSVPSGIFRYETTSLDPLPEIERQARAAGWNCIGRGPERRSFQRLAKDEHDYGGWETRIIVSGHRVYVGEVAADSDRPIERVSDTGDGSWAKKTLWPHLEGYARTRK